MVMLLDENDGVVENTGSVTDNVSAPRVDTTAEKAAAGNSSLDAARLFVRTNLEANAEKTLDAEGEAYLRFLISELEARGISHKVLPSTNLHLFYTDGKAIGILFTEHIPVDYQVGSYKALTKAYNEFRVVSESGTSIGTILDIYIVHKCDYEKSKNMVTCIKNSLTFGLGSDLQFEALRGCAFRISTSPVDVRNALRTMSPHGVPVRVDYGFVLEVQENIHNDVNRAFRDREANYTPVAVVGAFTDVVRAPERTRNTDRFLPIIRITDIQAQIRNIRLKPLLEALAVDVFYSTDMWLAPYSQFSEKSANLGNLFYTEDGSFDFVENQDQLRTCLREAFEEPIIVVDIQPGRATLPGMYLAADPQGQKVIVQEFWNFIGDPAFGDKASPLLERPTQLLTGITKKDGEIVDTRSIDYFAMTRSNIERGQRERYLMYSDMAQDRMDLIMNTGYKDVEPLYLTFMAPVNVNGLAEVLSAVHASLRISVDYTVTQNTYNASALVENSRRLRDITAGGSTVIAQQGFGGRNIGLFQGGNAFSGFGRR